MKDWFESWFDTDYYHILYKNRSDTEAHYFVDALVAYLNPKAGSALLDLACGKGRHARQFANHGLQVVGVDLSEKSISEAKAMEHDLLQFYIHDMRHIFRVNYFDIICNLFTSFGYFDTEHELHKAAKSIVRGLKPLGKFVIDFVNQAYGIKAIEEKPIEHVEEKGIRFDIKRSFESGYFLKQIQVTDGHTVLNFEERVKSFTEEEMVSLFEGFGLKHIKTFGTYELSEYVPSESARMILIFQKA